MCARPSARETEEDIFRLENAFRTQGNNEPCVKLLKASPDSTDMRKSKANKRKNKEFESFMDNEDQHVTSILPRIIERTCDYSTFKDPKLGPLHSSGMPEVCKLTSDDIKESENKRKVRRSLFAQQMDRLKINQQKSDKAMDVEPITPQAMEEEQKIFDKSSVVTGVGLTDVAPVDERDRIHTENAERLSKLSHEELLKMRDELFDSIDPDVTAFFTKRSRHTEDQTPKTDPPVKSRTSANSGEAINIEKAKLAWINEVKENEDNSNQTQARFNFEGYVIAESDELSVKVGLHHHGDEPERAGYSISELYILSRSTDIRQRQLAFRVLGRCVSIARSGGHLMSIQTPLMPNLLASGFPFLLRWGLDDNFEAVAFSALFAISQLVCHTEFEVNWLDLRFESSRGWNGAKPNSSRNVRDDELDDSETPTLTDVQVMENDLIAGYLQTNILQRLSFLLKKMLSRLQKGMEDNSMMDLLNLLSSLCLHSRQCARQVANQTDLVMPLVLYCLDVTEQQIRDHLVPEHVTKAFRLLRILCFQDKTFCRVLSSKEIWMQKIKLYFSYTNDSNLSSEINRFLSVILSDKEGLRQIRLNGLLLKNRFLQDYEHHYECSDEKQWLTASWISLVDALMLNDANLSNDWFLEMTGLTLNIICMELRNFKEQLNLPVSHHHMLAVGLQMVKTILSILKSQDSSTNELRTLFSRFEGKFEQLVVEVIKYRSFDRILRDLRSNSFITMSGSVENSLPDCIISPEFIAFQRSMDGSIKRISPLESGNWCMDVVRGFVECTIEINMKYAADHEGIGETVLTQSNILLYLQEFLALPNSKLPYHKSHILSSEVDLIVSFLNLAHCLSKTLREKPRFPVDVYHSVGIRILSHMHPSKVKAAEEIISGVIFHSFFVDLDNRGIRNFAGDSNLVAGIQNNLKNIASTYTSSMSSHQLDSESPAARLFSNDWSYQPILQIFNFLQRRKSTQDAFEEDDENMDFRRQLTHSISWIYYLEGISPVRTRRSSYNLLNLTVGEKLVRLFCFFLSSSDLFLESKIEQIVCYLLEKLIAQIGERFLVLEEDCNRAGKEICSSFYDLYLGVLKHFFGVSYGSSVFTNYILIPTMTCFSEKYRRLLWSEFSEQLRIITIPISECVMVKEYLLDDSASSLELLRLQAEALLSGKVSLERNPVLYLTSIHALNRALYRHVETDTPFWRFQKLMLNCLGASNSLSKTLAFHLQYYKSFQGEMVFYNKESFPEIRRLYLSKLSAR